MEWYFVFLIMQEIYYHGHILIRKNYQKFFWYCSLGKIPSLNTLDGFKQNMIFCIDYNNNLKIQSSCFAFLFLNDCFNGTSPKNMDAEWN